MRRLKAILEDMQRLLIMAPRPPPIIQLLLRELSREPAPRQPLQDNVRQGIIGCRRPEVKPDGAWLTREHTLAEADTAMLPTVILTIPLLHLHLPPEDIIVAASLGILSGKDALTALALEVTPGTDQNAYRSPRPIIPVLQATIQEEAIIILPAHTSTVVLQAITGMAANAWQAVMKVQVGQIQQPDPQTIVKGLVVAEAHI